MFPFLFTFFKEEGERRVKSVAHKEKNTWFFFKDTTSSIRERGPFRGCFTKITTKLTLLDAEAIEERIPRGQNITNRKRPIDNDAG